MSQNYLFEALEEFLLAELSPVCLDSICLIKLARAEIKTNSTFLLNVFAENFSVSIFDC